MQDNREWAEGDAAAPIDAGAGQGAVRARRGQRRQESERNWQAMEDLREMHSPPCGPKRAEL